MSVFDILLLSGLALAVFLALRFCLSGKKGGCCGDCARCRSKAGAAAVHELFPPSPAGEGGSLFKSGAGKAFWFDNRPWLR